MRARGGGTTWQRRKRRCEKGAACLFKHEPQHMSEYVHDDDEQAPIRVPKRQKTRDKWRAAGPGHVLDASVVSASPGDGKRCTYCRKVGHNILSCDAPGADAELRRRAQKKEAKKNVVGSAPPPVPRVASALPEEYLARMAVRGEPAPKRAALRSQQDDAYEQARQDDLRRQEEAIAKEDEEEMARVLEQSRREAEEAERMQNKRRREELEHNVPPEGAAGSVSLQFQLPDGTRLRRSFWSTDQLNTAVAEMLLTEAVLWKRKWIATQLPSREPVLAADASGRLTTAKPLSVGALGRAAIFVAFDEDE